MKRILPFLSVFVLLACTTSKFDFPKDNLIAGININLMRGRASTALASIDEYSCTKSGSKGECEIVSGELMFQNDMSLVFDGDKITSYNVAVGNLHPITHKQGTKLAFRGKAFLKKGTSNYEVSTTELYKK